MNARPRRHRLLAALLLATLAAGCGDEAAPPSVPAAGGEPGPWRHGVVEGVAHLSGVVVVEDELLAVAGGGDQDLYAIPVDTLVPGRPLTARKLVVEVVEESYLSGADPFAAHGYQMRHLWDLAPDFQGVGVQGGDLVFVAEAHLRLVFWGLLSRTPDRRLHRVDLKHVFAIPGADRRDADKGDWRDHAPGIVGLLTVDQRRRTEDLIVLDRTGGTPDTAGLVMLDRSGHQFGSTLRLRTAAGTRPDLRAVVWDEDHYLALVGPGRGVLVALPPEQEPPRHTLTLADGEPTPEVPGVRAWRALARATDGTLFLVSGGPRAVLAWRSPR